MNLSAAILAYAATLADSPRTQKTYSTGLNKFCEWLARKCEKDNPTFSDLYVDVLVDFKNSLAMGHKAIRTQRLWLACVKSFLRYAERHDLLPRDFSREKAIGELSDATKRSTPPPLQIDEGLPKVIAYYDGMSLPRGKAKHILYQRLAILRARAFVHILYSSAARLAEVAALDRKDVGDGKKEEVLVHGKEDSYRTIYLTAEARAAIKAYLAERNDKFEPLFISHWQRKGSRLSNQALWQIVADAGKRIGVHAHPHGLRHFRASQMLNADAPIEAIAEILGHKSIQTTISTYAKYDKKSIRAIFDKTSLSTKEALEAT